MRYDEFKKMYAEVQNKVALFLADGTPTLDEVELFVAVIADYCWLEYGYCDWNYDGFHLLIENTVRNEILRACV